MRKLNNMIGFPLLVLITLAGYTLPWVVTSASSLSLGAYDLAEWSSLHPDVRQTTPFLWTVLALRVPLLVLGLVVANYIGNKFHKPSLAIACLFIAAITLLPPLEFFTSYHDDPNYRQQFALALLTMVIGIPVVTTQQKTQIRILFVLTILGALGSAVGLLQAQNLLQSFNLHAAFGLGGAITSIGLVAIAFLYITKQSS